MGEKQPSELSWNDLVEWVSKITGVSPEEPIADGNDWLTIIRLHAMIETALNGSLLRHLGYQELSSVIGKLDTSNQQTGKVAFAKALGVLTNKEAVFIQKLSETRNFCVHDIHHFRFNAAAYLSNLNADKRKEFVKGVMGFIPENYMRFHKLSTQGVIDRPILGLVVATMEIMRSLFKHDLECQECRRAGQGAEASPPMTGAPAQSTPTK
jgi:hypothetical protein